LSCGARRCFFAYLAINTALGVLLYGAWTRQFAPQTDLTFWLVFGVGLATLMVAVAVGLLRGKRIARWAAVAVAVLLVTSTPVVGLLLVMYLCRPELDGRFR
jgi:hypothetical protein